MRKDGNENYFYQFQHSKIIKKEITNQAADIVMFVRPSMMIDLDLIEGIKNGTFFYSMWNGYIDKPDTKAFIDHLLQLNFTVKLIHTSGHADSKAMKQIVNALQPKHIVPIHTFNGNEYHAMFSTPVIELRDGEVQQV